MTTNDRVSDTLTRIKNAVMRRKTTVEVLNSKMVVSLLEVLKQEQFIEDFTPNGQMVEVTLKYIDDEPIVENFKRVSKPGSRIYTDAKSILPVMNGRGISIISTSEGLMTGAQAKSKRLGGEYICKVW